MKDIARQGMSIKVESMDLLNSQIKMEAHASATYLAMASWCDQNGFFTSAKFFRKQSEEEREHMMKIFDFLIDAGGSPFSPEVTGINHDYASIVDVFESTLDHEIAVTKSIHNIVMKAREVGDIATERFLDWFVMEQVEEENTIRDILDMISVTGTEGVGLQVIDDHVGNWMD
ncbi:ferritin [Flagellimonas flava]|uniref:Ferritin n=1 Tax=Flagellimonas flava TaxID=570519 RepID=A0A1M5KEJ0_9FLAO|nr:ferritin [Allomuricauda flava]SHG50899.1 ferritin [Allomuricauda flava]